MKTEYIFISFFKWKRILNGFPKQQQWNSVSAQSEIFKETGYKNIQFGTDNCLKEECLKKFDMNWK